MDTTENTYRDPWFVAYPLVAVAFLSLLITWPVWGIRDYYRNRRKDLERAKALAGLKMVDQIRLRHLERVSSLANQSYVFDDYGGFGGALDAAEDASRNLTLTLRACHQRGIEEWRINFFLSRWQYE
jgi:hypothetical protein